MHRLVVGIVVISCTFDSQAAFADAFSIQSWLLTVGLNNGNTNEGAGSNTVMNPFNQAVSAHLNNSTPQAAYNFAWTTLMADFSIDSSISCQGPISASSFGCSSSGKIVLSTTEDVILRSDIGLAWNLAPGDRQAILDFDVLTVGTPSTTLLTRSFGHSNINGGPPNGSFGYLDNTLLPAGGQYRIQYTISFLSFNGSPTALSTGTSHIGLHLEPVPEPATLGLLSFAAIPLIRRRPQ